MTNQPLPELLRSRGMRLSDLAAKMGINKSTVTRWSLGRIPAERVIEVERLTGISRHELRADIFGPPPWQLIPVTNAGHAKVDEQDFERVSSRNWYAVTRSNLTYVESSSPTKVLMHRFILDDIPAGMVVDHINGDPLDNRRGNLRICSQCNNSRNSRRGKNNRSGYKGVSWKSDIGKWRARIMVDRKEVSLGAFDNPEDAARVYDEAAIKYFGEFASLNFGPAERETAA